MPIDASTEHQLREGMERLQRALQTLVLEQHLLIEHLIIENRALAKSLKDKSGKQEPERQREKNVVWLSENLRKSG